MALNIAVCMKAVPNPEQHDRIQLAPVTKTLVRTGVDSVINSAGLHGIELVPTAAAGLETGPAAHCADLCLGTAARCWMSY